MEADNIVTSKRSSANRSDNTVSAAVPEPSKGWCIRPVASSEMDCPNFEVGREIVLDCDLSSKRQRTDSPDLVMSPDHWEVGTASEVVVPPRKRRFVEEPPKRKRRSMWDVTTKPGSAKGGDTHQPVAVATSSSPLSASEVQREALSYLNLNEDQCKDTYMDAVETGGLIKGGTWEHRQRARELIKSADLTVALSRAHTELKGARVAGLQSYLPPELSTAPEVASLTGPTANVLPAETAPLPASNKGYQLLQKAGWKEGHGLGAAEQGMQTPLVATSQTTIDTVRDEDEFTQYRNRMMLAYRFRPNPLNNPRRSYAGYQTVYDSSILPVIAHRLNSSSQS